MFSNEERVSYAKSQIVEVICQLRFPEILSIETTIPDRFQEAIRHIFPQYSARKEIMGATNAASYQDTEFCANAYTRDYGRLHLQELSGR